MVAKVDCLDRLIVAVVAAALLCQDGRELSDELLESADDADIVAAERGGGRACDDPSLVFPDLPEPLPTGPFSPAVNSVEPPTPESAWLSSLVPKWTGV